jgi:hypothetical protein
MPSQGPTVDDENEHGLLDYLHPIDDLSIPALSSDPVPLGTSGIATAGAESTKAQTSTHRIASSPMSLADLINLEQPLQTFSLLGLPSKHHFTVMEHPGEGEQHGHVADRLKREGAALSTVTTTQYYLHGNASAHTNHGETGQSSTESSILDRLAHLEQQAQQNEQLASRLARAEQKIVELQEHIYKQCVQTLLKNNAEPCAFQASKAGLCSEKAINGTAPAETETNNRQDSLQTAGQSSYETAHNALRPPLQPQSTPAPGPPVPPSASADTAAQSAPIYANTSRAVRIGNLGPTVPFPIVHKLIRGGVIEQIFYTPNSGYAVAWFLSPRSADRYLQFAASHEIWVDGRELALTRHETELACQPPAPHIMQAARNGCTSMLYVDDDYLMSREVYDDCCEIGTVIETHRLKSGTIRVVFASLYDAYEAHLALPRLPAYVKANIVFARDECGIDPFVSYTLLERSRLRPKPVPALTAVSASVNGREVKTMAGTDVSAMTASQPDQQVAHTQSIDRRSRDHDQMDAVAAARTHPAEDHEKVAQKSDVDLGKIGPSVRSISAGTPSEQKQSNANLETPIRVPSGSNPELVESADVKASKEERGQVNGLPRSIGAQTAPALGAGVEKKTTADQAEDTEAGWDAMAIDTGAAKTIQMEAFGAEPAREVSRTKNRAVKLDWRETGDPAAHDTTKLAGSTKAVKASPPADSWQGKTEDDPVAAWADSPGSLSEPDASSNETGAAETEPNPPNKRIRRRSGSEEWIPSRKRSIEPAPAPAPMGRATPGYVRPRQASRYPATHSRLESAGSSTSTIRDRAPLPAFPCHFCGMRHWRSGIHRTPCRMHGDQALRR